MDMQIEKKVISAFWNNRQAERVLFELGSSKKRRECIWRFDGTMLNEVYCRMLERNEISVSSILKMLKQHGAPDLCYVFSIDQSIDGAEVGLSEAVGRAYCNGPALISCVHGKLAYLECENEGSRTKRYLLMR